MPPTDRLPRVLFLCTANSCRSQMAEGWARALKAAQFDAWSAGVVPSVINPLAVRAMREAGVDISGHTPKSVESVPRPIDLVVTVCDAAKRECPVIPGVRTVHVAFDDPPRLAQSAASDDEAMPYYRRVRDEIRAFVDSISPALINDPPSQSTHDIRSLL